MAKRVFIPLCPGFEEMEAIIMIDVLRRGNVEVVTAGKSKEPILAARKTLHLADQTFSEIVPNEFDAILLPGGLEGTKQLMKDPEISSILKSFQVTKKMIGAICAAPNVLRHLDIITGEDLYTAFPSADDLAKGKGGMYTGKRIESHNNIHTSIGPGSAFEFSLYILEKLEGKEIMEKVKAGLQLP
ncbi:DJ-1/PfpI family protein [Leptospira sp. 2 VSF19]|uniref:DJ-1/PfpI family protein n=1 Tax=Leptospira soteropolitanensis TaxID=2950025 RepID=A0AAW5VIF3_9LEPT|nr:DJ-1 family glyoxalase III [Leptospira soteropolitanensis]MCW7494076.1 DJ-1/PfpI family protein [Leptospira soteropolitanensis]MCW7501658.1 DJ-1/PfpI family protein [Leptospira soteropolitanensis]MCW7523922.1 DJ-1/PfpI family protein [Leptospira soteropolitanensis]MCW7527787.1 DJ-1/PfpI family protein [Leptospira soteropolitanensis]MCW7531628.1 DJ-1/PfpI family protein [Leptospira soteropolitanensis]